MSRISQHRNVAMYAVIAAFGSFVFGLDAANISGAVQFVSAQFGLDSLQIGMLVGCAIVGVIIALFFTGALCEKFGRKRILIAIALTYSLSTILSTFAINYPMLLVGRFIGGIAFASITVSAMYIGEIAPADRRGQFVSVSQLLIALGLLLAFVINYFLVKAMADLSWLHETNVWRFMLGFEIFANIIWFSTLLLIPESPRWLMKKGRVQEARRVFGSITPPDQVEEVMRDVQSSIAEDAQSDPLKQLKVLFGGRMNYVLAIAICYAIVQGATGMNAVLFFAPTVFAQIGMSVENTFFQTILIGMVGVVATVVAIFTVEKFGRRLLTLGGLALIVIAHTSIWFGFSQATYTLDQRAIDEISGQGVNVERLTDLEGSQYDSDVALKKDLATIYSKNELPLVSGPVINSTIDINPIFVLVGIFAFLAAFNVSIGPVMWVIFSEVFPNSVRSVALPFAALVQSVSSYLIQQFFPWQLENLGAANTFLTYAVVGGIGLFVMIALLPETKGKSIEQLERDLVKA